MNTTSGFRRIAGLLVSAVAIAGGMPLLAQPAATPWTGPIAIRFSAPLQANRPVSAIVPVPSCGYEPGPVVSPEDISVSRNGAQIAVQVGHGSFACFAVGNMQTWEYAVPLGSLPSGSYTVSADIHYTESPTSNVALSAPLVITGGPGPIASTALPASSDWSKALLAFLLGASGLLLARRRLRA